MYPYVLESIDDCDSIVEALCSVAQLIEGSGDYVECQMSDPEGLEGLWHSEVGAMANIVGWQMNALVRTRLAAHGAPAFMPDFNVPLWPHFWRFVHDELQQAAKFHSVYVHRFKLMLKAMPIFEHDCLFEFTRRQWPYQWY